MLAFITHLRAKPGKRDALIAANKMMQDVTAGEEGVPIYVFHTAVDDPDEFYYYDLYETQESYEAHMQTPEFKQMTAELGELADFKGVTPLQPFGPIKSEAVSK